MNAKEKEESADIVIVRHSPVGQGGLFSCTKNRFGECVITPSSFTDRIIPILIHCPDGALIYWKSET